MKRCFCLFFALSFLTLCAGQSAIAFSPDKGFANSNAELLVYVIDDQERRGKTFGADPQDLSEKKERKGIGAGFWGGPYWGYGPRWGHACESCRSSCASGEDNAQCQRCRVRCGW